MKFSILVPVYNKEKLRVRCLESLLALRCSEKEIIAVDDGSQDASGRILESYLLRGVKVIHLDRHSGIISALNKGLSLARGDIIVKTDADTIAEPDWLNYFKNHFLHEDIIAVGGSYKCLNADSCVALSTSTIDNIFVNLLKRKLLFNRLAGANRAIRRDALLSVGGFSAKSDLSEDLAVFLKLKKLGKIIFDPFIVVKTHYPDNLKLLCQRHYNNGKGAAIYLGYWKVWIRPVFILGFYLVLLNFLTDFFIFHRPRLAAISFFALALLPLLIISITSLFLLPKRSKFVFSIVPLIFIIQNTAYFLGILKGALCLKKT